MDLNHGVLNPGSYEGLKFFLDTFYSLGFIIYSLSV